jgi:predicted enzyme related to lactoylglutathione lyase
LADGLRQRRAAWCTTAEIRGRRREPAFANLASRSRRQLISADFFVLGTLAMNANTTVKRISPMLAVADMEETLAFYRDVLGFAPTVEAPGYSVVERDGQSIHFQLAASEEVLQCVRGHTEIYIEVRDIAALWTHVQGFMGRYRIRDLFERDYGMTEFHIEDPNQCLVFVGEPTPTRRRT